MSHYGEGPVVIAAFDLPEWQEFMHYLYLPVRIPFRDSGGKRGLWLPERLSFLHNPVGWAVRDAITIAEHLEDPYVYVTARRGFATPGNPLNRPGWHCDDFGGTDLNYIWSDAYPTRVMTALPGIIQLSSDDGESMIQMENLAQYAERNRAGYDSWTMPPDPVVRTAQMPVNTLLRLTPHVIHDTPVIPPPGGMRSFFKISVSSHRYDLIGNSHNHLLDYDWPMTSRVEMRNRPDGGNTDDSGERA